MDEILKRVWENLIGRSTGPINFRLINSADCGHHHCDQGRSKGRAGRPTAILVGRSLESRLSTRVVRQGWKDVGKVFILAVVLDSIYQLIVHRGVYVLELLITATVLAIIPYVLVRGPVNRIARRRPAVEQVTKE